MKSGLEAKKVRLQKGMNQSQFWLPLGVGQSAGSRYESGRDIPAPVQKLLLISYGKANVSQKIVKTLRGEK